MSDVLTEIIPGGGESFSAVGDEPGGEGLPLAACVSASLLEDFLWPEVELPDACETFASFKAVMAPGPRHDPDLRETRALPFSTDVAGCAISMRATSRACGSASSGPTTPFIVEIIERVDEILMRDLGLEWNVNMRPDDRNSQANWLSHKLSGLLRFRGPYPRHPHRDHVGYDLAMNSGGWTSAAGSVRAFQHHHGGSPHVVLVVAEERQESFPACWACLMNIWGHVVKFS